MYENWKGSNRLNTIFKKQGFYNRTKHLLLLTVLQLLYYISGDRFPKMAVTSLPHLFIYIHFKVKASDRREIPLSRKLEFVDFRII